MAISVVKPAFNAIPEQSFNDSGTVASEENLFHFALLNHALGIHSSSNFVELECVCACLEPHSCRR